VNCSNIITNHILIFEPSDLRYITAETVNGLSDGCLSVSNDLF
jgi:hypothetical protein